MSHIYFRGQEILYKSLSINIASDMYKTLDKIESKKYGACFVEV